VEFEGNLVGDSGLNMLSFSRTVLSEGSTARTAEILSSSTIGVVCCLTISGLLIAEAPASSSELTSCEGSSSNVSYLSRINSEAHLNAPKSTPIPVLLPDVSSASDEHSSIT